MFAPGLHVWVWKVFLLEGTSKARSECFCCCAKLASKNQAWFVLFLSYLKTHANLKHISNLVSSVSLLLNPRKAVALVSQPPLPGMCIKDSVRQALHALRCAHLGEADAFQKTEEEVRMSRPTAFMSPPTPENTRGTQGVPATPAPTPARGSTAPAKEAPVKGEICPNCSLALKVECFGSNNWRGLLPKTKMVNKKMPSWKGSVYTKGFCCRCNCLDRLLIHPKACNASLQCVWLTCCHFEVSLVRCIEAQLCCCKSLCTFVSWVNTLSFSSVVKRFCCEVKWTMLYWVNKCRLLVKKPFEAEKKHIAHTNSKSRIPFEHERSNSWNPPPPKPPCPCWFTSSEFALKHSA